MRRLSLALRPGYLEDLGLVPGLEALAADVRSKDRITIQLSAPASLPKLSPEVELAL